jgi:hypothetical protein
VSAIQKGKKKIEEVAAKAKDAVTSNGHDAEEATANGNTASDDGPEAHKSDSAEVEPVASQEQVEGNTPAHEADSAIAEPQTTQLTDETVR